MRSNGRDRRIRGTARSIALVVASAAMTVAAPATRPAGAATSPSLIVWGSGGGNTIGTGAGYFVSTPLPGDRTAASIAAGEHHVLVLANDHTVWAWGANSFGEIGADPAVSPSSSSPVQVTFPYGVQIDAVAAGNQLSLALGDDGTVYAWGDNTAGQLGTDPAATASSATPLAVAVPVPAGDAVVEIAAGDGHALARTANGVVFGWGANGLGQLGFHSVGDKCGTIEGALICEVSPVVANVGAAAAGIGAGGQYTYVLTDAGAVLEFGPPIAGQSPSGGDTPTTVVAGGAASIAIGLDFGLALASDGHVIGWGDNQWGQLGNGTQDTPTSAVPVSLPDDTYDAIAAGGRHSLVRRQSDGHVLAFGDNGGGNVHPGDSTAWFTEPFDLDLPDHAGASLIAAGTNYSMATIDTPVTPPAWVNDAPPTTATVGLAYAGYTFHASGVPAPTYEARDVIVPDGLTLNATTGVLNGTPTLAGDYTFTVHALVNSLGIDLPGDEITIHVNPAPPMPPSWTGGACAPLSGTVNESYFAQFTANGTAPITYSIVGGTLPDGLALNATTGQVIGVPTEPGAFGLAIRATNAASHADANCAIVVLSPATAGVGPTEHALTTGQRVMQPARIGYDAAGNAYEVYSVHFANFNDTVYLRVRPPGGPWGAPQPVPGPANTYKQDLSFAVNAGGDLALAWRDGGITVIRRPAGGAWGPFKQYGTPGQSPNTSSCPNQPVVGIGDDGTAVVTWSSNSSCNGLVTRWEIAGAAFTPGGSWQAIPQTWHVSPVFINSKPTVAVAADGHAVVAWGARDNSGVNFPNDQLWTAELTGGTWGSPVLRSNLGSSVISGATARASGTTIAVAWFRNQAVYALEQANGVWDSGAFVAGNVRVSSEDNGPGLALGTDGSLHVAYASNVGRVEVHVADRPAGGGPFSDTRVSRPEFTSINPVLDVGITGELAAAWDQFAGGKEFALSALRPAGGAWTVPEPVSATPSDNTTSPEVAIDVGGHVLTAATPLFQGIGAAVETRIYTRDPATASNVPSVIQPASATVGETLACITEPFGGTPPFTRTTAWFSDGSPLPGTANGHTVTAADVGQPLTCSATAVNDGGSATSFRSEPVVPVPDDADGVPATTEDAAPNNGDGNADGIADSQQPQVASLPNAIDNAYVTIVSPDGTTLANVEARPVPASPAPPPGADFPVGLFGFRVDNVTTPSIDVHLLLPPGVTPTNFFKLQNGAYVDATSATSITGNDVTLTLVDNGPFDTDPTTGVIVDPVAPAVVRYHAPVATADGYSTDEDHALTVTAPGVLANDSIARGYSGTAILVTPPARGTLAFHADGSFVYVPVANDNGAYSFTYKVSDGVNTSNAVTVGLTVDAVNDAPVFTKGANQSEAEDGGARTVNGWATAIKRGPANESGQQVDFVVTNDRPGMFASQPAVSPTGTLTWTPAPDANGTATVSVKIHDNGGIAHGGVDTSAAQTFTITITPVNDPPSAATTAAVTLEDTPASITLTGTDVDGDATSIMILNGPAHGRITSISPRVCTSGAPMSCSRTVTYVPSADFNGSDAFRYRVDDGRVKSPTVTVPIVITPVNDPPTLAEIANRSMRRNTSITFSVTVADVDTPTVSLTLSGTSSNPTLVPNANIAFGGTGGKRTVTITPAPNRTGTATVTITVSDGALSATRTLTLQVT